METLAGSTRLSASSVDTLVEETLLSPLDSDEAMEASMNPHETQTDEANHTAPATAPLQEQEGNPHLAESPKPKCLLGAATRRKREAIAKQLAREDQREQTVQHAHCQLGPSLLNGPLNQGAD